MTELEQAEQDYAAARAAERVAEWKAMEAKAAYYHYASAAMTATAEVMGADLRRKNAKAAEFVEEAFAIAALEPAPAEQSPAKDTDDWRDNRRRFAHPTRFEDGPLGVSFDAGDVIPDWLLLPDYVWTTQADGSVLVTPQAPALADPLSAELRSDLPASEEESRDQFEDEPDVFISILTGDPAIEPESGLHVWTAEELVQLSAKADAFIAENGLPQIDAEPTELDAEPVSVLDNPELLAAVERAEATLAIDAQTCEPIYPHPQPAYVGLQDPELDADYDAMREREKADKPKLHFSIFGERGNRKLEEVE